MKKMPLDFCKSTSNYDCCEALVLSAHAPAVFCALGIFSGSSDFSPTLYKIAQSQPVDNIFKINGEIRGKIKGDFCCASQAIQESVDNKMHANHCNGNSF